MTLTHWCRVCRCQVSHDGGLWVPDLNAGPIPRPRTGLTVVCSVCYHRARLKGTDLSKPEEEQ